MTAGADGAEGQTVSYGTVFKVTSTGDFTHLVDFGPNTPASGSLTLAGDGNLYGMTAGTVFQLTPSGDLTTVLPLGTSTTGAASGAFPLHGQFTLGADGDLYGTTTRGGQGGGGIMFKLGFRPWLILPTAGTKAKNLVSVSFHLTEPAAPGSLKLALGDHVLTIASSMETAGSHSFSFDPAAPAASAAIASGGACDWLPGPPPRRARSPRRGHGWDRLAPP